MEKSTKDKKAGSQLFEIEKKGEEFTKENKLSFWKDKYARALNEYGNDLAKIDEYFRVYEGSGDIYNTKGIKAKKGTSSVRKVVFELIESQTDGNIPMPKVVSLSGNENRAITIEHYIKNEIDRLPFDNITDIQARTTPIAGASFMLVEWDNSVKTRNTVGKMKVTDLDPKCVIPQPGVFNIPDMDYIFIRLLQSKQDIKNRYDVDIDEMEQTETEMDESNNDELVTHIYCYYKDENGKICLFSWVNNTIINDYDNYFARKEFKCSKCGKNKIEDKCECGSTKFDLIDVEEEEITITTTLPDPITGMVVPKETKIKVPYYTPKSFPIVKRINVSKRNSFLGSSDVEAIKDQQNDLNIMMAKIKEKVLKGGSIVTIPEKCDFKANDEELKILKIKDPAQKSLIDMYTMQPNISTDMTILDANYNIARQTIGITNSFQGREDTTATSGKAKQISAENAAGRFESKRTMRNAAFADLYKLMFQFMLAYADEPRSVYYQDQNGQMQYKLFDKRMFIDRDETGEYYYDDEFIFDTDESSTLANNRQYMWEQTRGNFTSGAYGDPSDINTIVMFWQMMNNLHYPSANEALNYANQRLQEMQMTQEKQMQIQNDQLQMQKDTAYANSQAKISQASSAETRTKADAISKISQIFKKDKNKNKDKPKE